MSRRRPGPVAGSGAGDPFVVVRIVCTGRRTHKELRFGEAWVRQAPGTPLREAVSLELTADDESFLHPPEIQVDGDVSDRGITRTFTCRRCPTHRHVPLQEANLLGACLELAALGESRLDISALGHAPVRLT